MYLKSNTTLPKYKQLLFAAAVGLLLRRDSYYLQLHLLVVVALVARLLLHGMQGLPRLPRRRALAGGRDLDDDLLPLWIRKETEKKAKEGNAAPCGARARGKGSGHTAHGRGQNTSTVDVGTGSVLV